MAAPPITAVDREQSTVIAERAKLCGVYEKRLRKIAQLATKVRNFYHGGNPGALKWIDRIYELTRLPPPQR